MKRDIGMLAIAVLAGVTYVVTVTGQAPTSDMYAGHYVAQSSAAMIGGQAIKEQKSDATPQAPTIDASAALKLQGKAEAYLQQQIAIQKELDALDSQFQREITKLQQQCAAVHGFDLTPQLTCAKKPDPPKGVTAGK